MKPWLEAPLTAVLASRAHAVLVEGVAGLGQFDLARAAAAAWLCDTPLEAPNRPTGRACGECEACRSVASCTHHDLMYLLPEAVALAESVPIEAKAQDELDKGKRQPSKQIRVDAVLGLVAFAQQTDARGRGKVAVVYPAERMNDVAANALLKVLEEPPGDMHFLLVCESGAGVMPTIRSRCQTVRLSPPDAGVVQTWLVDAPDLPAASAPLLSAAGGLPLVAMALAQSGMTAERWAALPGQLASRSSGAELLAGLSVPQAVEAMQKLCHDVVAVVAGAAPRYFGHSSVAAALATKPSLQVLHAWWEELGRQARHSDHPVNAGLALEVLVVQARRALHSPAT
jgi:DNA polymerase III subunit delta'